MTHDWNKICQKIVQNVWYAWVIPLMVHVEYIKYIKMAKHLPILGWIWNLSRRLMHYVVILCPADVYARFITNFRNTLKAIHSAYLVINIVWYFQNLGDNDISTILWKWYDNCITILWGLVMISTCNQELCLAALRSHSQSFSKVSVVSGKCLDVV